MAFTIICDWLVTVLIVAICTAIVHTAISASFRHYYRSKESSECLGYTYWYSQSIYISVAANRRRLQRIETKIDQAIKELQKAQDREVAHRQELTNKVAELQWIVQGIRNRQQEQGQHIIRISHEQHQVEERLANYLRDIR